MKRIERTLKPKFMVTVHQNCCGYDDGFVLEDIKDGVCLTSFPSISMAKKAMKQDIKEFQKAYSDAIVVMDLDGLRAKIEMPFTNGDGRLDTFVSFWKIVKI